MIIKNDKSEIYNFLVDASNYKGYCDAVYFPECIDDACKIIQSANEQKLKITIAGNGTGLTGARVPEGGIVISTDKLSKIIAINSKKNYAIVQPGILLREFHKKLDEHNLFYPPDPTEQDCYIGGTIATNASGAKTFKYGSTRSFVQELKIVLPTGDLIHLKRGEVFAKDYILCLKINSDKKVRIKLPEIEIPKTKHTAGYLTNENLDAIDLFVGAEGTLGLIVEAKLKLLIKPKQILSGVVFFDQLNDAFNFVECARKSSFETRENFVENGIDALGLEFFDKNSLEFLREDYQQIPINCEAAVWFEQDFSDGNEDHILEKWFGLIENNNGNHETVWFASDMIEREKFKDFRHAVSSKVSEFIAQHNITKVGTDTAVPHKKFKEFFEFSKNSIESADIDYIAYGHIGDSHLHFNMLPKSSSDFKKAKNIYFDLCKKAVELGGTISAEHGIGKLKREYLLEMFGKTNLIKMMQIKKALDPNSIMCIGNIFEEQYLYE